ncbi:hypothetical protein DFP73DRAFT_529861 [Morchella snyderi]|nr:hypothetical protein DFP73DRAFT_529861 [Morchella snyderi]
MPTAPQTPLTPHPPTDTTHLLQKFHSTLRIYRDLFSRPGARTVNWAPLMDVKYEQLLQHHAALRTLRSALDEKKKKEEVKEEKEEKEEEAEYARAWALYLGALEGYGELCEMLKPGPGGASVATVGVKVLEGRRGGWGVEGTQDVQASGGNNEREDELYYAASANFVQILKRISSNGTPFCYFPVSSLAHCAIRMVMIEGMRGEM